MESSLVSVLALDRVKAAGVDQTVFATFGMLRGTRSRLKAHPRAARAALRRARWRWRLRAARRRCGFGLRRRIGGVLLDRLRRRIALHIDIGINFILSRIIDTAVNPLDQLEVLLPIDILSRTALPLKVLERGCRCHLR